MNNWNYFQLQLGISNTSWALIRFLCSSVIGRAFFFLFMKIDVDCVLVHKACIKCNGKVGACTLVHIALEINTSAFTRVYPLDVVNIVFVLQNVLFYDLLLLFNIDSIWYESYASEQTNNSESKRSSKTASMIYLFY